MSTVRGVGPRSRGSIWTLLKPSVNWLLVFVPLGAMLDRMDSVPAPLVFFTAALAIVPAAALIVRSTEQIAARTGDAVGGLLNATFGNAPELIIATVALRAGLPDMVRASIIGAVLANLLLAIGLAFLLGGLRHRDQQYSASASRVYSTMMLLAVISLIVPSAFERSFSAPEYLPQAQTLNTLLAWSLLAVYGLYLVFMLRTHPHLFKSAEAENEHDEATAWSMPRALGGLLVASVLAAWMSELLVGAAEATGDMLGMSEVFIGIVIVAIVGGAAESLSAISAGRRNKVDLTLGIAYGSSVQIALFVAPVLVLLSRVIAPEPLRLAFAPAELWVLFLTILIGTVISGDGRSNWFKGAQLIAVYAIIALFFYFVPELPT
ncbi:MAG: calcium/proton exchanger [Polyangiales bacterium]